MKPDQVKQRVAFEHRQAYYLKALDKLFEGKVSPEYVAERFGKLKEIRGK